MSCKLADLVPLYLALFKLRALMTGSLNILQMREGRKMGALYLMGLDVEDLGQLGCQRAFGNEETYFRGFSQAGVRT